MATAIINSQMDAINESFSNISSDLTTIRPLLKNAAIGAYPTDTTSGAIASFSDGADNIPVKSLSVDLEPVQDLNGYDNPWPAGGGKNLYDDTTIIHGSFTTASVTTNSNEAYRTIKLTLPAGTYTFSCDLENCFIIRGVWDGTVRAISWGATSYTFTSTEEGTVAFCIRNKSSSTITDTVHAQVEIGRTATAYAPYSNICPISGHTEVNVTRTGVNVWDEEWERGQINTTTGGNQYNTSRIRSKNYIPVVGGMQYYLNVPYEGAVSYVAKCYYDANKNFINGENSRVRIITMPQEACYLRFSTDSSYGGTYNNNISINYPSTDTDYHAYNGTTYPISLGETVYGGTLNVTTGALTIDRAITTIGALSWGYSANAATFNSASLSSVILRDSGYIDCEAFKQIASSDASTSDMCIYVTSGGGLRIKNSNYTDADAFKSAFTDTKFTYGLATPTTVQLTPTQVSTLLGQNNIWSDSGEVEVTYRADTTLYIQQLTKPDDDFTADASIASGKFFMVGNRLFISTTAISAGESIVIGTNCTEVSLADALNQLNA